MMDKKSMCYGCLSDIGIADVCPYCGFDREKYMSPLNALPLGTELDGRYIIAKVLGSGGFGITYLAFDTRLECSVAIKEYLPKSLALREATTQTIQPHSMETKQQFEHHMDKFMEEARVIAKFNHEPGIVSVQDVLELNNTVYIIMHYVNGITLDEYVSKNGGKLSFDKTLQIMNTVMRSLAKVHKENLIHRDISPDNIYITRSNQVKLLDFGAARYVITDESQSLSIILKPGFAPIEQYSSKGNQGPWTDVYAVSATIYWMLTGVKPQNSMDRMLGDEVSDLKDLCDDISYYSASVIMKGMEIDYKKRIPSMDELLNLLNETDETVLLSSFDQPLGSGNSEMGNKKKNKEEDSQEKKKTFLFKYWKVVSGAAAIIIISALVIFNPFAKEDRDFQADESSQGGQEEQLVVAADQEEASDSRGENNSAALDSESNSSASGMTDDEDLEKLSSEDTNNSPISADENNEALVNESQVNTSQDDMNQNLSNQDNVSQSNSSQETASMGDSSQNSGSQDISSQNDIDVDETTKNSGDVIVDESDSVIMEEVELFVDEAINIPDQGLEEVIRMNLNKPEGDIMKSDLRDMRRLNDERNNDTKIEIRSLEGLQYCEKLEVVHLGVNDIESLEPLTGITTLKEFDIGDNFKAFDLSPIGQSSMLEYFCTNSANDAMVRQIGQYFVNLKELHLERGDVTSLEPVSHLTNLRVLNVGINNITEYDCIRNFTLLEYLDMSQVPIKDYSFLIPLRKLVALELDGHSNGDLEDYDDFELIPYYLVYEYELNHSTHELFYRIEGDSSYKLLVDFPISSYQVSKDRESLYAIKRAGIYTDGPIMKINLKEKTFSYISPIDTGTESGRKEGHSFYVDESVGLVYYAFGFQLHSMKLDGSQWKSYLVNDCEVAGAKGYVVKLETSEGRKYYNVSEEAFTDGY